MEELREKAAEVNYLRAQADAIQKQIVSLNQVVQELKATQTTLDKISELKKGSLMPLGAGVFASASIQKEDSVLVDVGARTLVQKSPQDAKKTLQERFAALEKALLELQQAYIAGAERAEQLSDEIEDLVGKR